MEHTTPAPADRYANLDKEKQAASRVTVIGMVLDAVLGLFKMVTGTLFHSHALVVDGIHSFTDVASDLMVLGVMRVSRQAPDEDHPYGHQRIETFGTLLMGSLLIAVGAALAWENVQRLLTDDLTSSPGWPVLAVALLSVVGKEWIFRYTRKVGQEIRSDLIIANAWHSRTDAFSSGIVVLSTIGAMLGYLWLDTLAAVVVAGIIIHMGWSFGWSSIKELVDTGLSVEDTERLLAIAGDIEGVRDVHELRSRRMGDDILLDVHLVVRPDISVSEGHQVGMRVVGAMRKELDNICDINFHIDAEDDESYHPTSALMPSRKIIQEAIHQITPEAPTGNRMRLHYLKNKVHLELFLDGSEGDFDSAELRTELGEFPWFGSLRLWQTAD
jgi:cation diffusion facilitator family transporter